MKSKPYCAACRHFIAASVGSFSVFNVHPGIGQRHADAFIHGRCMFFTRKVVVVCAHQQLRSNKIINIQNP